VLLGKRLDLEVDAVDQVVDRSGAAGMPDLGH
jgi:hypothetical protein